MNHYTVHLRADVLTEIDVEADSEEDAEQVALEQIDDAGYEVDFEVESISSRGPVIQP